MASKFSSSSTNASQIQKNWNTYKANKKYQSQLKGAEKKQPTYKDAYKGYKDAVVNQLENGSGFEFDSNNPVYQAYSDDYRLLGNIAADASQANIEGLSGGYGTTYSGTVAQQGLQSHLANEKNIIPALYEVERANYQADQANLVNRGNLYNQLESQDFARFQDKLNRWNANRDYYYNKFITDYQQSAKQHATSRATENSAESSVTTGVSGRGRTGKSVKASDIKSQQSAQRYLIANGYGNQLDDMLTKQEYVTQRAQMNRSYHAENEEAVDADYSGYLYNYIQSKLKGKGKKK